MKGVLSVANKKTNFKETMTKTLEQGVMLNGTNKKAWFVSVVSMVDVLKHNLVLHRCIDFIPDVLVMHFDGTKISITVRFK